jgi:hypothetical protein
MRLFLPLFILAVPLCAQDREISETLKSMTPKLAERPAGPLAVFKFGGGRGTSSTLGDYLGDLVGQQLLSLTKRPVITRDQTSEFGPATQSRMADMVAKFHAAVAVTGNYTVLNRSEISVTVFFRDPETFIAFAGETVKLPRTEAIDAAIGDAPETDVRPAPASAVETSRGDRGFKVFRPDSGSRTIAPAPPSFPVLPRGTNVAVRLIEPVYSDHARPGQRFRASLDQDLTQDGAVIAAAHADSVVEVLSWNGRALGLALRSIRLSDGRDLEVTTAPVYHDAKATKGGRAKSGLKWGAIGAAIGAVAGGAAGAAVGAGAGAGAGSTVDPGKKEVSIASETKLEFRVE